MKIYYEITSMHQGSSSTSPVLCSVYGYTDQLDVVQYFISNQDQFPNLNICKYDVHDKYTFFNAFISKHGIPLGDIDNYELEMRGNILQTKQKPLYAKSDDYDQVVAYQRDIYYTNFERTMLEILLFEKFLREFSLSEEFSQLVTILIRYLQKSKKCGYGDGYDILDCDSLLIELIEEEGNHYYGDN